MLIRWPLHRARLLRLLPAPCLIAILFVPQFASAQGYSLGPEQTRPLAPQSPPGTPAVNPPAMPPADAPRQIVADVGVVGNNATKEHEIFKHIQTRRDREFDSELLQGDARRLLQTGLFRDVKTYTRQVPGGVQVTFEVFERPRINYLRHLGNRGLSEKKLINEHGLKQGDPLNAFSSEEARRKIEELYRKSGYPNATVTLLEGNKKDDQGVVFVDQRRADRANLESRDRRQHDRQRGPPRNADRIEAGIPVVLFPRQGRPREDRRRRREAHRLLPQPGLLPSPRRPRAEFDESGKWVTLRFTIDEGPRYVVRNVTVEGNEKFASRPLLEFLELKSGKHFNQAQMNKDLNTIVDLYGSQGHVFADVQADPRFLEEPGTLDLVYRDQGRRRVPRRRNQRQHRRRIPAHAADRRAQSAGDAATAT